MGLEKIKITSLLTYTPPLTSAAPTHHVHLIVGGGLIGLPLYPRPAAAEPALIYGANGLVPSDSDALQNVMHDQRFARALLARSGRS